MEGGLMHARFEPFHRAACAILARLRLAADERGQGTVEYVGLILLVSLLMVGMVAAMKGFNGTQGTELAEVIISKVKQAVNAITFR
jgi:Flp pilus assembly pilin Flp